MPPGLANVVNTKIFLNSDLSSIKAAGLYMGSFDVGSLKKGYCMARIHGMNELTFIKFPLALAGVLHVLSTPNKNKRRYSKFSSFLC